MTGYGKILQLLRLLEQESDENNILTMSQIRNRLSPPTDRRTVYSLVDMLIYFGYDISTYAENKKGYFLRTREFEDCEIRFLIDSVATSKSIPNQQRKGLIEKLMKLSSKNFKCALKDIQFLSDDFTQNPDLFFNIELVDEAISTGRQIMLSSCNFGTDKKLHSNYNGRTFLVNPYKMVVQNQKYYLICNYDGREGLTHIRLDRMTNVSIAMESSVKPLNQNLSGYINEHPYMYTGESVKATMRISRDIIGDVLDTFGMKVRILGKDDGTAEVTLKASRQALCYWAIQYGTKCEILSPETLRTDVAKMIKNISDKYVLRVD
jgi:predicted DNA-binding transcriptional regulator YafY